MAKTPGYNGPVKIKLLGYQTTPEVYNFFQELKIELQYNDCLVFEDDRYNADVVIVISVISEEVELISQCVRALEFGGYAILYYRSLINVEKTSPFYIADLPHDHEAHRFVKGFDSIEELLAILPDIIDQLNEELE